ncbi:hypothetical protein N7520_001805 [Penicillium odoratum]|uniref:uncharacterized protein n=1 Tax=Penicillium odoratum TaxID=1167516 RepID=UPI00254999F5|nr:uncharacterized protein N7520_001805 [Penicillium odoratum]KAJ5778559.1 hypothetical protein N7520_001805 [Penicillium odoratum]
MLLSLPPELILLILERCDSTSFLQAAFSCRTLLEIATSSRDVVLEQLYQTPGHLFQGVDSARQRFHALLGMSHEALFGVEFQFERKCFNFEGKVIDSRASTFADVGDECSHKQVLLVFKNDSTVYLLDLRDGVFSLKRRLEAPDNAKENGDVQILHTSCHNGRIYVLHRVKPFIDQGPDSNRPFVKQALQSYPRGTFFLACYDLNSEPNAIYLYGFPYHGSCEPLSFAVHDEQFVISWQHVQHAYDHQVVLYTMLDFGCEMLASDDDLQEDEDEGNDQVVSQTHAKTMPVINCKYSTYILSENPNEGQEDIEPTVKLEFNDQGQQLLHYYRAQALYGSFQRIHIVSPGRRYPTVYPNSCDVEYSRLLGLNFSIGIPFFSHHDDVQGSAPPRCEWRYLSIGIATHRKDHWTVACILQSQAFPLAHRCDHAENLGRGRRFDNWKIMAQLGGFKETITSQGSLFAISPRVSRIAMASWKTVTVWAIDTNAVLANDETFYHESLQTGRGYPELRPAVIHLDAVCSQLKFTERENELVAITDRGLILLHLMPDGCGIHFVDCDGAHILKEKVTLP